MCIRDSFSRFAQLTVERLYTFQWATLSPKIAPHHGGSGPHLIHDFLGQSELTVQTASRSFIRFRTGDRRVSVYVTIGRPFPHGRIWTPCNAWFLGPTRVLNPNGISIGASIFEGITSVTDRQTDRQTITLLRCGLKYYRNRIAELLQNRHDSYIHPKFYISTALRRADWKKFRTQDWCGKRLLCQISPWTGASSHAFWSRNLKFGRFWNI